MKIGIPSILAPISLCLIGALVVVKPAQADTTITVDTFGDETNVDGNCSLREAIQTANTNMGVDTCVAGSLILPPGTDTILLPPGIYTLTITNTTGIGEDLAAQGDLDITDNLVVVVAGGGAAIIQGGSGWNDRILDVASAGITVTLSRLTIQDGNNQAAPGGGGIRNNGMLTLTEVTIISNTTTASTFGGGMANLGTVTLVSSTVAGNTSTGVSGNGGGLYNAGPLAMLNSTISDNVANNGGGGVYNDNGGKITLTNVTVSGNIANNDGGGLLNFDTMNLNNVTLTNNTADSDDAGGGNGGGFRNIGTAFNLKNTVVAGNIDSSTTIKNPDCLGTLNSLDYNLIQDITGCTIIGTTTNNKTGMSPGLGPLQDNGGPTFTHALLMGSPAIDAGNPAQPGSGGDACEAIDQRGVNRPQGAVCDIGAFEAEAMPILFKMYVPFVGNNGN